MIRHLDEPVADSAIIPTFLMARLTKRHVTVVLTGEGADELFAGYSHYKIFTLAHRLRGAASPLSPVLAASPLPSREKNMTWRRITDYALSLRDPVAAYLALKAVFSSDEKADLYSDDLRRACRGSAPPDSVVARWLAEQPSGAERGRSRDDYLSRLLRLDIKTWLSDDLLVKVDRMTMAHAVEARVPYLDHEVVEAAMNTPSSLKLRWLVGKRILRRLARGLVPATTARRRKTGFGVPISRWAHASLRAFVEDVLSPESVRRRGLFRPEVVRGLLARQPFCEFHRRQFWTLATLELWCRAFVD